MHTITIMGQCGAGKSSLLRSLRARLSAPAVETVGLLPLEHYRPERLLLVGRYADDEVYPGGDRVDPEAAAWLRLLMLHAPLLGLADYTVLWDGPWGTDDETLRAARAHTHHTAVVLAALPQTMAARRRARECELPERDLASRAARVARFVGLWTPETWSQERPEDLATNTARLQDLIRAH